MNNVQHIYTRCGETIISMENNTISVEIDRYMDGMESVSERERKTVNGRRMMWFSGSVIINSFQRKPIRMKFRVLNDSHTEHKRFNRTFHSLHTFTKPRVPFSFFSRWMAFSIILVSNYTHAHTYAPLKAVLILTDARVRIIVSDFLEMMTTMIMMMMNDVLSHRHTHSKTSIPFKHNNNASIIANNSSFIIQLTWNFSLNKPTITTWK